MPRRNKYFTVEDIIGYRCNDGNEEYQVSWNGYTAEANSWINALEVPPFFKDRAYKKKQETIEEQRNMTTLSRVAEQELYSIHDSMTLVRKDQCLILVSLTTQTLPGHSDMCAVRVRKPGSLNTFIVYMEKTRIPPLPIEQ